MEVLLRAVVNQVVKEVGQTRIAKKIRNSEVGGQSKPISTEMVLAVPNAGLNRVETVITVTAQAIWSLVRAVKILGGSVRKRDAKLLQPLDINVVINTENTAPVYKGLTGQWWY